MYQLTKINNCCHVFDAERNRFVRSSAANLRKALGSAGVPQTRREMLSSARWELCQVSNCRVRQCKSKHYIAR